MTHAIKSTVCIFCKNYIYKSNSCKAYPNGVPHEIDYGDILHNKILPNQIGEYIFEERTDFSDYDEFIKNK